MNFDALMHIAFFTDQMDEMIDFYANKLGAEIKVIAKYKQYMNRDDRPVQQKIAKENPEKIFNVYLQLCPGQFIELFPKKEGQKEHDGFNESLGYSHFSLTVKDINEAKKEMEQSGIAIDTPISIGPSATYQFWIHDPDGNKIEVMQFTEHSYQVTGHFD